ncbi:hypothetical protein ABZ807_19375 [Micromonospora sp. NPDC047548]|uniref:WXG100 family type VII secretion target n=1 Tax=Micromonospora sp. NPDC047548 TaxID=3155624 RepID=UPI0033E1891C
MSANNFWVDPDALERHARPYEEAADGFDKLSTKLDELLARYPHAFGQDDLGQQFSSSFNKGVDGIKDRIDAVSQRMAYIGDGLRVSAQSYRQAEDSAQDVSTKLNSQFHSDPNDQQTNSNGNQKAVSPPDADSTQATARTLPTGKSVDSSKNADLQDDTLAASPRFVPDGKEVGPSEDGTLREDTPKDGDLKDRDPKGSGPHEKVLTASPPPADDPVPGQVEGDFMTSRTFAPPATGDGVIQIDGVAVDDDFHLIGANEILDGKVRLDVDGYESIIPVGTDRSVTIDGVPVPVAGDQQLFLVKDAPTGSAHNGPGNVVEFGRDGSAVGLKP